MERYSTNSRKLIIDNQPMEYFGFDKFAKCYEERALLLASAEDIVVLRCVLPPEYIEYLYSTGLKNVIYLNPEIDPDGCLADVALLDHEHLERAIRCIAADYHVSLKAYIPDDKMQRLAETLHIPLIGRQFYEDYHKKSSILEVCKVLGLRIIDTLVINSDSDFYNARTIDFLNSHDRVLIKPDSGIGGRLISELSDSVPVDNQVFPAVLQEFLPAQSEGSIQFFDPYHHGGIYLCNTFQENFAFRGFHYPANPECRLELRSSADLMLSYFKRTYPENLPSFGIDFIVSNGKVYFHDINPRSTGTTYVFSLLRRAYGEKFLENCEFIYIQITNKSHASYQQLRTILDRSGISHISANNTEGYALLYPSMLSNNILNLLIVSERKNAYQYLHRVMEIVG